MIEKQRNTTTDQGRALRLVTARRGPCVRVHCPRIGCTYVATARREGQAIQAIATHLVRIHALPAQGKAS